MSAGSMEIFILIDALGWTYIKGRRFLSDLLPYRRPLRTVLGFSSGAIPAILTGLPPSVTGQWNLVYYDPQGSPFRLMRPLRWLPERMTDTRVTRKLLKEAGRRLLGLGPGFECCVRPSLLPFFNWGERRNIYARGGIPGVRSMIDALAEGGVPHRVYSYHECSDAEILRRALADVEGRQTRFLFLYLSEMDKFLHGHCNDEERVNGRLDWYEAKLRELAGAAERNFADVTLTVCSDHGMTPVACRFDLVHEVEGLGFHMPQDYLAVYDSTMARFWFFSDRCRRETRERLESCAAGRILTEKELRQGGVYFEDGRFGELIFLLHPGYLIAQSDFNNAKWNPVGMHGYDPADPHSDAIYLSNRRPATEPETILDIRRCVFAEFQPAVSGATEVR